MRCAWQAYLKILPQWMRNDIDLFGRNTLQELRLRTGQPPELVLDRENLRLTREVAGEDLQFVINSASQYSPWIAETIANGVLTAPGGHRIGICGTAVMENGTMRGIRDVTSVCIRVARDFCGIAKTAELLSGSVLIIGPPGSGKTTFLRDLIRQRSLKGRGSIGVVDERGEIFPVVTSSDAFFPGARTDVLRFCGKPQGIIAVLKVMGPCSIAVDEITEEADCRALQEAAWCSVSVLATAHAMNINDLKRRPLYRLLTESGIFDQIVTMHLDKTWSIESVTL